MDPKWSYRLLKSSPIIHVDGSSASVAMIADLLAILILASALRWIGWE